MQVVVGSAPVTQVVSGNTNCGQALLQLQSPPSWLTITAIAGSQDWQIILQQNSDLQAGNYTVVL